MNGNYGEALYEAERSLLRNWHNAKARALKAAILYRMNRCEEAAAFCRESLEFDKFNYGCLYIEYLISKEQALLDDLILLAHGNAHNYDEIALDFCAAGLWKEAEAALAGCHSTKGYYSDDILLSWVVLVAGRR